MSIRQAAAAIHCGPFQIARASLELAFTVTRSVAPVPVDVAGASSRAAPRARVSQLSLPGLFHHSIGWLGEPNHAQHPLPQPPQRQAAADGRDEQPHHH